MTGSDAYDIAIIGMGPVGAAAANLAGTAGLRTLVLERGDMPYRQPRAIVFDAEIMRIFASVGLAERIAEVTKPLGGSIYLGADLQPIRSFRAPLPADPLAWHSSNLFYQPQLEALLRAGLQRFAHVDVRTGHDVLAIEDGAIRMRGSDGDEAIAHARFILACDGASSTVRKSLGIPLDDIGFEERWLVIDTLVDGPMRWPESHGIPPEVRDGRYSLMVCDPARPATLIPGAGRHRRWEYMLLAGESDDRVLADGWLRGLIGDWIDPDDVEIVRAAVYRFRALLAARWRAGNVFLLGDAAHQTPPFYGQGMCHGIRDAAQLMWRLALVLRGQADDALLDGYQPEREPHVRAIISASVAAGAAVCMTDPDEAARRDEAFRAAERGRSGTVAMADIVPPIRAGLVDAASGGMRLPEFVVDTSDGRRHLDRLLGGRFALVTAQEAGLAIGDPRWPAIDGRICATSNPALANWLGDRAADWALVRPDRYVFAIGRGQAALDAMVAALFDQLHIQPDAAVAPPAATETAQP
ncbi:bifunctional 3-(3-hydroxy-phenyl)propionate/3-hydroxycinnamic acid hydroxylase [Sphingomonas colocasiae]|uniref:Bifunctional 3-(3-hydroxy-phenyl)propionate/3-hydroxycinnamic acid hydroxylase n=1 Tax=Sphingomonas colocasiae TaxID=1848973 RepID=A0ABS7Q0J8_9SPHN|nr:bifunctional 3-(3-hydroxy-phenyl)propionate/3-hydroxycinnamic acid hydroxylase [Sphingomonas colocasiae]MBY8825764.1 bifunctional 3-(3-hydroxy-phenyl)propionate/3-hydroxycinnamic acid hydroxylase [Sphingomonas colocasiae]